MSYWGTVRGGTIQLDEAVPLPEGQRVRVELEPKARVGTAAALLAAMKQPPHLKPEDVDELDQVLRESKTAPEPVRLFDDLGE